MESKAAQDLAAVLTGDQAKVEFKAPLPKKKGQPPKPRPRPFSPERGPKPAQRGRSPAKTDKSSRVPSQSPISRQRKPAMKDRSRSRSTSITREPALPTDPQQLAELEAYKQQRQEQGNSWTVLQRAPPSGMSQGEKKNLTKQLAEEDKKRQKIAENDRRQLAELEANRKSLEKREKELQRQEAALKRQKAEFERQRAEADLVRGQGQPNAYTTRILAAQGPGVGPGVGPVYETTPPRFFNPPDPGDSVSRTRAKSPDYATAEGKKKKNRKRSVKNKKGNKKKKKGGKVSKKN